MGFIGEHGVGETSGSARRRSMAAVTIDCAPARTTALEVVNFGPEVGETKWGRRAVLEVRRNGAGSGDGERRRWCSCARKTKGTQYWAVSGPGGLLREKARGLVGGWAGCVAAGPQGVEVP